ncbi:hypothetical protein [Mesorhizobium album]|uniref:hypothetical protein n=1 Tax=Mesorhizobium album TaxID=3072314 RepID=UPI003221CA40
MANGGVSSPTDPINFQQFSISELEAIVEEAANAQTYVSAHLYTDEAISRAVRCGVRSVEHTNLAPHEGTRRYRLPHTGGLRSPAQGCQGAGPAGRVRREDRRRPAAQPGLARNSPEGRGDDGVRHRSPGRNAQVPVRRIHHTRRGAAADRGDQVHDVLCGRVAAHDRQGRIAQVGVFADLSCDEDEEFPIDLLPLRVGADGCGKGDWIEKPDEHDKRRVLDETDESIHDPRNGDLEKYRCRFP